MSLPARLLGSNPSVQVSSLLTGNFAVPSAKLAFAEPTGYDAIASYVVSTATNNIDFSAIPANKYKHLQIRVSMMNNSGNDSLFVRFNGDSGSNYSWHQMYGTGSSTVASSYGASATWALFGSAAASTSQYYSGTAILDILDFNNPYKYTTTRAITGGDANGSGTVKYISGMWRNTEVVNRLTLYTENGNFSTNSVISVYGIRG